ncbi:uncharacterized protein LOC143345891 isoform X2 [Colletes latitarsis]|uniref:uncharacterized protein LOC143345891 isoform X2 n=1 Tax=Colletes latitarsis TaxID=2605962 RepID=UPI004036843A
MENTGAVMIEGENYKVVDECIEDQDTSNTTQNNSMENSIEAENAPMVAENKPMVAEKELMVVEKEPMVAEKEPMVAEEEPIVSEKAPMVAEKEPVVAEKEPMVVKEEPIVSEKAPMVAEKEPMVAEKAPVVAEKAPMIVEKEPIVDKKALMVNEEEPEIDEKKPMIVEQEPVNVETPNENIKQDETVSHVDIINSVPSDKLNTNNNDQNNVSSEKNECTVQPNTDSDNLNINNNEQNGMSNEENKCSEQLNTYSIDFTADINLDQLDDQKDITDEDVLDHLNEIENIVLNSSDFPKIMENDESDEQNVVSNSENDVTIIEEDEKIEKCEETEKSEPIEWYKNKLAEKEAIIKDRLSKVARVLGISYPCYEQWLEWEEYVNGSPLCKLKPARQCCLKKPYTNRWKFICSRKRVQESPKKTSDADTYFTKDVETVWKLEASGAWGVNVNNESEFPPFVMRAVKIFEEFLQTTEPISQNCTNESFADDISVEMESKPNIETNIEGKQEWSWLLVRCNSMDELMLFATGKNINRSTMDRLKHVYESGPGKDCNVKSLYCKSTNKCDDTTVTDTTFLVGSEALDEVVGGLKVQLAPKTNFWSNTAGAENVANTVMDLLAPSPKSTLLEIGCGIGLIGLMMASKCQQVIGVDSPSEVEEAEMTCELNNIKNASFIMGSPTEVIGKIITAVQNRKTCAVINANTNIGRAIEVMTCLRKIPSLKRIVMITTLTKQSVRAILELARPANNTTFGSPFIPILACVVDTLPVGPHFEAVILLQRRMINKFNQQWSGKNAGENVRTPEIKIGEQNTNGADKKIPNKGTELRTKKNFNKSLIKHPAKKSKAPIKKPGHTKTSDNSTAKNKFKGKRALSPDKSEGPPKKMQKFVKFGPKAWQMDLSTKKKNERVTENSQLRINPLYEKKLREHKEQIDLRERLSSNRFDTDIAQTVKEHQALLEIAKEKLSGPAPTVDVNTAKQLQNMLNMVLEQTNKLQSQLPRSVWDRIAPPENVNLDQREIKQEDALLKGRYIQEMNSQDIVITTANKKCLNNEESEPKTFYKKYNNLPPLEPNTIMPVGQPTDYRLESPFCTGTTERYETDTQQQTQENSWNRDNKSFERSRWNEMGPMRRIILPMRKQSSPIKHRATVPKRFSPKRPLLSPPRRPCSPPRRHFSPLGRPNSPVYRQRSPLRRQMSPPLRRQMSPPLDRPVSPLRRVLLPRRPVSPRRQTSSPLRVEMSMNRLSPLRRQASPSRRQISPIRVSVSPPRRQLSPIRRQMSPSRRQIPSPNRMISPNRQEMLLSKRQTVPQEKQQISSMRRAESPQRFLFGRLASPPRRQQSPQGRQMSPMQRYVDEWDIPSRGAIEQNTGTWPRSAERMIKEQNVWRNEKPSTSNNDWDQTSSNDRRRKTFNQEKWDYKESIHDDTWISGSNNWNSTKPVVKETWPSSTDNRWSNTSNIPGSSNDNWNIRGKESANASKESWMEKNKQVRWESLNTKDSWKQSDKEDLNDLPEDARDPWGDDGNLDLKERWFKLENTATSSTWKRENEQQNDTWSKQKDNWQNKGLPFNTKPQWQNNGIQNVGESRWMSQNDNEKKNPSNAWQSGKNVGSWQTQNSNFQQQRSFSTQFKGLH